MKVLANDDKVARTVNAIPAATTVSNPTVQRPPAPAVRLRPAGRPARREAAAGDASCSGRCGQMPPFRHRPSASDSAGRVGQVASGDGHWGAGGARPDGVLHEQVVIAAGQIGVAPAPRPVRLRYAGCSGAHEAVRQPLRCHCQATKGVETGVAGLDGQAEAEQDPGQGTRMADPPPWWRPNPDRRQSASVRMSRSCSAARIPAASAAFLPAACLSRWTRQPRPLAVEAVFEPCAGAVG